MTEGQRGAHFFSKDCVNSVNLFSRTGINLNKNTLYHWAGHTLLPPALQLLRTTHTNL